MIEFLINFLKNIYFFHLAFINLYQFFKFTKNKKLIL
jgi:hypothetical protein